MGRSPETRAADGPPSSFPLPRPCRYKLRSPSVAPPAPAVASRTRPLPMSLPPTRWSLVARTGSLDRGTARTALGELCEAYWQPLLGYARQLGRPDDDARDLVQSFCLQLLERGGVDAANADRGRFRDYLRRAFRNFVHNRVRHERAAVRGGGQPLVDVADGDPDDDGRGDPEQLFEQRWAYALLDRARQRLHDEHQEPKKRELLRQLEPFLLGDADAGTAAVAQALGCSDGAVRVALHRLRTRWRELVRSEVADTVADPALVDDELRTLREALGRGRPAATAASPSEISGPGRNTRPTAGA